jgi:hypothetical protein
MFAPLIAFMGRSAPMEVDKRSKRRDLILLENNSISILKHALIAMRVYQHVR